MNDKGRIENSIRNSFSGVFVQAASTIMGLVARTFFIKYLSAEHLGVNGLFSNVLTMLSLAEMGIGGAITYSMYKPVADKDELKIAQLMNLYRTAYRVVGTIIAILGICVIPFLDVIIKDRPNIDNLILIYLLFLGNTVASYFFAHKKSVLSADQMERIVNYFALLYQLVRYVLQIITLILWKNYIVYLLVQITCTFLDNFTVSMYVDKKYPFLKRYANVQLDESEKKTIFDNIKALFIYKIGSTALDGTDNIIISAFDGVIKVGLLSNYSLLTGSLQTFINKITQGLTGSVGNYIAREDKSSDREQLLENITFVHYILYGLLFVCGMAVLNPFVALWAGEKYLLSYDIVFVHCLNIYIYGMMNSIWMFRSTMGLFVYGRFRPLVSAVVNIIVSILLANRIGLLGVLLGTTITRMITNVWFDPYIVYKHGLKKSPLIYYIKWACYLSVVILNVMILHYIDGSLQLSGILAIILYGLLSVVLFGISVSVIYGRSTSYIYMKKLCMSLFGKIGNRICLNGRR